MNKSIKNIEILKEAIKNKQKVSFRYKNESIEGFPYCLYFMTEECGKCVPIGVTMFEGNLRYDLDVSKINYLKIRRFTKLGRINMRFNPNSSFYVNGIIERIKK